MKGILFVEFIDFLESNTDPDTAQEIINNAEVASGGAYSRVGLYDYQELIQLLVASANKLDRPADELLGLFSEHLMSMFSREYPDFFSGAKRAADILKDLDSHIHVQVKKLYPDAELPSFDYEEQGDKLVLTYQSPRPLAGVAHALIGACIKHFDTQEEIVTASIAEDQCSADFIIASKTWQYDRSRQRFN